MFQAYHGYSRDNTYVVYRLEYIEKRTVCDFTYIKFGIVQMMTRIFDYKQYRKQRNQWHYMHEVFYSFACADIFCRKHEPQRAEKAYADISYKVAAPKLFGRDRAKDKKLGNEPQYN